MIEAVVNLDGIEVLRVELKHLGRWHVCRIEDAAEPVFVMPTRCTDMNFHPRSQIQERA